MPRKQNCKLEIFNIEKGTRQVLKSFDYVIEAPNWTQDGRYLIYNAEGCIYRHDIEKNQCEKINTGEATNCNNDHVLSPDGSQIAVSHHPASDGLSRIYILPIDGGTPELITKEGPSYLHGWSPDGQWLVYCAERKGNYDVYRINIQSKKEEALTNVKGLNDGPEYSPGGQHIWFNSTRSGLMQIWRMDQDGSNPVHVIKEEANGWFPHVSPDGKKVVYLTYKVGDLEAHEHLPDKRVALKMMNYDGSNSKVLFDLDGGQGTINVNSWAPDSKAFAFVSY